MAIECYRFVIQGISTGEQCQNVLHFLADNNDDATPLEIAQELVGKWDATFKATWLDFQSNRYGIRYVSAKRVLTGGGNTYWREFPEGVAIGDIDDEQGVLQLAPIVKLFTSLAANVQGRVFLPSPPGELVQNNSIDSAYQTDVIDHFDSLLSFNGGTHDYNLGILSRKLNQAFPVNTCTMSNILGSVGKRRQPM